MSLHRRAAKRDAAEPAIVSALEALGCVVWRVSGKGLPDLIVLRAGKKWLADVKAAKKGVTEPQAELWEKAATKARCAVFILRTPEDAAAMLSNALQPWEPAVTGSIRAPRSHGYDRRPHKRDAAKAREEGRNRLAAAAHAEAEAMKGGPLRGRCAKNGCRRMLPCATHTVHPVLMGPMPGYTPPRSKPVAHNPDCEQVYHSDVREPCTCGALDAAKEAEATFAPPPNCCAFGCPKCIAT